MTVGLFVDLFAGGGGTSAGVEEALGRPVDLAINHDPHAIAMHAANHPHTEHLCESVFDVDPVAACRGRPVWGLWASPDCTHHSRAKGGKPRDKKIRGLAWVVIRWAALVAPEVIFLENVEEFQEWGPLGEDQRPIRERRGETFRGFVGQLQALGYEVEWRSLAACDYGAPTTRRRLFLVARRDGRPIVWPEPTHGPGRTLPWRTAAECIDWSIPVRSIFGRERPLAEATQRRIAEGLRRFVLENARPFLVHLTHGTRPNDLRVHDIDEPMRTVTGGSRGDQALVAPFLTRTDMQSDGRLRGVASLEEPVRTITTAGGHAIVAPWLVNTRNGEREGQAPRVRSLEQPTLTTTAKGSQGALVAAFLAKHYGGPRGHRLGSDLRDPLHTVTAQDHHGLVAAHLTKFYGTSTGAPLDGPVPTITGGAGGGHHGLVAAFLTKYYSRSRGQSLEDPLHTATVEARFGLVTVTIDGEEYAIVDIGMRMLQPRELARAQGVPDSYVLIGTKTQQIARIGNMVCPPVVVALVRAQVTAPPSKRAQRPVQMPVFRGDQEAA